MREDIAISAELDLAGCLLYEPGKVLADVRTIVFPEDFLSPVARAIYETVQSMIDGGELVDPTSIISRTAERGTHVEMERAAEIMHRVATTASAPATAEMIHNAAMERAAANIGAALNFGDIDAGGAITKLQELVQRQSVAIQNPLDAANSFLDYVTAASAGDVQPFVSTGFAALDKQLAGGFVQSGLITLAARPGTGKTTAALNLAERVAERGQPVLYFSLEMDYKQLWARRVGAFAGLNYSQVYRGKATDREFSRITAATGELSKMPFCIYDKPCTVEDIERVVRGGNNPALIVIDHIGLIKNSSGRSRYELMTDTVHRLKQLALSTGIPILALCQLNRQSEGRESKIPTVADLRDTGAIEEDSDVVMLLHRPAMYADSENAPKPWEPQELQIIVGKNRHGMQGLVKLDFIGLTARIMEMNNERETA